MSKKCEKEEKEEKGNLKKVSFILRLITFRAAFSNEDIGLILKLLIKMQEPSSADHYVQLGKYWELGRCQLWNVGVTF